MPHLRQILFIAFCTTLLFFTGILARPLLKSSEGRVAVVAQEMIESGDWIVPHLNGEIRKEKPPFSSWMVALLAKASGAARVEAWHASAIPAATAVLLVLIVFAWVASQEAEGSGRTENSKLGGADRSNLGDADKSNLGDADKSNLGGADIPVCSDQSSAPADKPIRPTQNSGFFSHSPAAMFSALVLATCVGFISQARSAELDMLMALWVTLALAGYFNYRAGRSPGWLLLCYVAMAFSILTKGHVGIIVVVPTILVWHFYERSFHTLRIPKAGSLKWHLLGVAIVCLMVLPWAIPFLKQSGIAWADFQKEGLDRFDQNARHAQPAWWYLQQFPIWFLPWFLLFPFALWQTRNDPPDERSPLRRLCWVWLLLCLIIFSAIKAKQRHYAVPFFPPMAILIADSVIRWLQSDTQQWGRRALAALAIVLGTAALVVPITAAQYNIIYPGDTVAVWTLAVLCGLTFFAAAWFGLRQGHCFSMMWAGAICLLTMLTLTGERAESEHKSPVSFCREVRAKIPPSVPLYDYEVLMVRNTWKADVLFYMQMKVLRNKRPLTEFLQDPAETGYALVSDKLLAGVSPALYETLATDPTKIGHDKPVYLIRPRHAAVGQ